MRRTRKSSARAQIRSRSDGRAPRPGGELDLIDSIRRRATAAAADRTALRLGIGDDCALLRLRAREELAVTTDLLLDSRHFRLEWHPPESIGHRALARGLSDLAAMGARPVAAFLSLGLPRRLAVAPGAKGRDARWIDRFLDGFLKLAAQSRTPLAGGDVAESPLALADIVLAGAVQRGQALLRGGARADDRLFVTGRLGGAAAALARLADGAGKPRRIAPRMWTPLAPHLFPEPRLAQGQALARRRLATACIDLSDGLSTDLAHLCRESRLAAVVEVDAIPIAAGATLEQALHGGEDYELLFTASAQIRVPRAIAGVAITQIGRMVRRHAGQPVVQLKTARGLRPLPQRGWEHFA